MIAAPFMSIVAIFFPWLILLLDDNPGGALIALIMQATVIGWLPVSFWALRLVREARKLKKTAKKEKKVKSKATTKESHEAGEE